MVKKFKKYIENRMYTGRSEMVRVACRDFINKMEDKCRLPVKKDENRRNFDRENITVCVPDIYVNFFDELVKKNLFVNRSALMEYIIIDFFSREDSLLDFLKRKDRN